MTQVETSFYLEVFAAAMASGLSRGKCELIAYEAVYHVRAMNLPKYD